MWAKSKRSYLIAFNMISGIGGKRMASLANYFGSLEAAWNADFRSLAETPGIGKTTARNIVEQRCKVDPVREEQWAEYHGGRIVTAVDPDYPASLRGLPLAPPVLYIVGMLPQIPMIGVIGTRRPSKRGLSQASFFSAEFARQGCTVVSGLARGIDYAAHTAALGAGGTTVAVLGSNIGSIYPKEHAGTAGRISRSGALVSEFASTHTTVPGNFPRRNRIIAGLSERLLVVEAGIKSGAINTADWAAELGRDVWAIPGEISDPLRQGTNTLIQQGAGLAMHPTDVLLGLIGFGDVSQDNGVDVASLYKKGASPDQISVRLGVPISRVLAMITELELASQ